MLCTCKTETTYTGGASSEYFRIINSIYYYPHSIWYIIRYTNELSPVITVKPLCNEPSIKRNPLYNGKWQMPIVPVQIIYAFSTS